MLIQIEREAKRRVDDAAGNPARRKRMREAFYEKWGRGTPLDPHGFGSSELAFLDWEIARGVLDPHAGSPWWRAVNSSLLYWAEVAGLLVEGGATGVLVPDEVRAWVDYIEEPSVQRWYRAHNLSIVRGYLDAVHEARSESKDEQRFMNAVLYRLLYAEALISGRAFGELGEIVSDPRLPSVEVLVKIPDVYPRNYPLTAEDVESLHLHGDSIGDEVAKLLDGVLILPHIERLYHLAAAQLEKPELVKFVKDGVPIYPGGETTRKATTSTKKKIAILGGGPAGLAAAWELTNEPDWRERYEVTIYTLGFRVGGKVATGRGPFGRIEEHGIHVLQGWYHETFRMLTSVYAERREKKLDPRSPFQRWQDAFGRNDSTLITEWIPGRGWVNWPLILPPNDYVPGEGGPLPLWEIIEKVVALTLELLLGSPYQKDEKPLAKWILEKFFEPDGEADLPVLEGYIKRLRLPRSNGVVSATDLLLRAFDGAIDVLSAQVSDHEHHDRLRRILILAELVVATLRGILADVWDPEHESFEWSRIDHLDFRKWIESHGASERVLRCAPVRFLYCGTFSNLVGPEGQGGLIAAGTAMRFLLESAGYKGSFVWQSKAGAGDTVITPFYDVLVSRGVRFEFFRDVKQLHASGDTIDRIRVGEQVTLANGTYEPTIRVADVRTWPNAPLYDQIDPKEAEELRAKRIDLESPWSDWTCPRERTLVRGTDFDVAILAIPVASLRTICSELCETRPKWRAMIEGVKTTATMSMQLWVRPSLKDLGMDLASWGLGAKHCAPNAVVYASPMYSWLDMSLVAPYEQWPVSRAPEVVAYFAGAMTDDATVAPFDDHGFPQRAHGRLRALCEQWLWDNMGFFWPAGTRPEAPMGFDPTLLVGPTEDATPIQKLDFQLYRANVDPSGRYTLSLPGSARHRMKANESGFDNLLLAGDWTDFGMNVGYIEGALVSGLAAAHATIAALVRSDG